MIPYGTWVEIKLPNGKTMVRKAEDTGSAVKSHNGGRVIDVYSTASTDELMRRGRTHNVTVTILKPRG